MEVLKIIKNNKKFFLTAAFLTLFFFCILFFNLIYKKNTYEISFEQIQDFSKDSSKKLPVLYYLTSLDKKEIFAIAADEDLLLKTQPGWEAFFVNRNSVWDPSLCAQMKSVVLKDGSIFMLDSQYKPKEKGGKLLLNNRFLYYKDTELYEIKIFTEDFSGKILSLSLRDNDTPFIVFLENSKVFSYTFDLKNSKIEKKNVFFNFFLRDKVAVLESKNSLYFEVSNGSRKTLFSFNGKDLKKTEYAEFLQKISFSFSQEKLLVQNNFSSVVVPIQEGFGAKLLGETRSLDGVYIEIFDRINPYYFKIIYVDFKKNLFTVVAETETFSKSKHVIVGFVQK